MSSQGRRIPKQQGRRRNTPAYTIQNIRYLYYEKMLSKSEIARKLGIAYSTVTRVFQKNEWKTRPPPTKGDPEEARRLHEKGLTHKEIAGELGVSRRTVDKYLKDLGVESRRKIYRSDEEITMARREQSIRQLAKVKEEREEIFGTTCGVCGIQKGEGRKIAIHRKDFRSHEENVLWTLSYLRTLNPNDWAALCVMCHRGTHWVRDEFGMKWNDVEKRVNSEGPERLGERHSPLEDAQQQPTFDTNGNAEDIRKALFGVECYFCGPLREGKTMTIHRKDGTSHKNSILRSAENLRELNPEEWQALCQKHHRYVHWGMRYLGLKWKEIESLSKDNA